METQATAILEVIDNAIFLMESAEGAGACLSSLHNQALLLSASCHGFRRTAGDTFARSFAMRAEEVDQLAHRFLSKWQATECGHNAGCDCAAILSPTPATGSAS